METFSLLKVSILNFLSTHHKPRHRPSPCCLEVAYMVAGENLQDQTSMILH